MPRPDPTRSLFHLLTGLLLGTLIVEMGQPASLWLVGILFALTAVGEIFRLLAGPVNRLFLQCFGTLLKETERNRPTGVGFFLGGTFLALAFFDLPVALASLVILSVGDPAASYVGQRWGRVRIGSKSLEGSIGFFTATALIGGLLQGMPWSPPFPIFLLGAVVGAVVECLPLRIDDNLALPVATGLVMQAAIGLPF